VNSLSQSRIAPTKFNRNYSSLKATEREKK
jgi:hypothetical protein